MGTTIDAAGWPRRGEEGPAVVALGGGHGLSATLRALRHVTLAVGCTGGKHRSVASAERLGARLRRGGFEVVVQHRDLGRE